MFIIFEEENEPLTERAKVDELLSKTQKTALVAAVAQLRYQLNTVGITFIAAANHLNSEISQTPDYQLTRKISSVSTPSGGRRGGKVVAVAVVVDADHKVLAAAAEPPGTLLRWNGTSSPVKNKTRSARKGGKENQTVPTSGPSPR